MAQKMIGQGIRSRLSGSGSGSNSSGGIQSMLSGLVGGGGQGGQQKKEGSGGGGVGGMLGDILGG